MVVGTVPLGLLLHEHLRSTNWGKPMSQRCISTYQLTIQPVQLIQHPQSNQRPKGDTGNRSQIPQPMPPPPKAHGLAGRSRQNH